ncbi:MAG: hypothetical protein QXW52_08645 [Candidatus Caldarchaeum sp.]
MNDAAKRHVITRQIYLSQSDVSDLYSRLLSILKREGKSFNAWLYEQIKDYVVRHGEGNPSFSLTKWITMPEFVAFPTLGEPAKPELLYSMDARTLTELMRNAESWMMNADYVLRKLSEHQKYHQGVKVDGCPYCGEKHG